MSASTAEWSFRSTAVLCVCGVRETGRKRSKKKRTGSGIQNCQLSPIYLEHMMILKPLKPRKKRRLLKVSVHIYLFRREIKTVWWICSSIQCFSVAFLLCLFAHRNLITIQKSNDELLRKCLFSFQKCLNDICAFAFMNERSIFIFWSKVWAWPTLSMSWTNKVSAHILQSSVKCGWPVEVQFIFFNPKMFKTSFVQNFKSKTSSRCNLASNYLHK